VPNFAEPVSMTFIAVTVVVIFAGSFLGIYMVKLAKKRKEHN